MKGLSGKRPGNGAIRADQPEIEAQQFSDWQGKLVPPPGDQDDFHALLMRAAQRRQVYV